MRKIFTVCGYLFSVSCLLAGGYYGLLAFRDYSRTRFSDTHALLAQDDENTDSQVPDDIQFKKMDSITRQLQTIDGAVSWKTLAKGKLEDIKNSPDHAVKAVFNSDIEKLDHQNLIIQGFIFPLDTNEKQTHFVLSPYPVSCPYCLPAGPNELVEVFSKKPVKFSYEPVALKGDFELLTSSDQIKDGMMYRLKEAQTFKN